MFVFHKEKNEPLSWWQPASPTGKRGSSLSFILEVLLSPHPFHPQASLPTQHISGEPLDDLKNSKITKPGVSAFSSADKELKAGVS